ncbi:hypothetical protein WA026_023621, partial [Henosepilachna vigintioctopunctata]
MIKEIKSQLSQRLPHDIMHEYNKRLNVSFKKHHSSIKRDNIKKFDNLKRMNPPNDQLFIDNTRWFRNISSTTIPTTISDFLSLGPKFALKCKQNNIKIDRLLADIESVISEAPEERRDSLRARATNIVTNFLNNSKSEQRS